MISFHTDVHNINLRNKDPLHIEQLYLKDVLNLIYLNYVHQTLKFLSAVSFKRKISQEIFQKQCLLNLKTMFNWVNHKILISRITEICEQNGVQSFLEVRKQYVSVSRV